MKIPVSESELTITTRNIDIVDEKNYSNQTKALISKLGVVQYRDKKRGSLRQQIGRSTQNHESEESGQVERLCIMVTTCWLILSNCEGRTTNFTDLRWAQIATTIGLRMTGDTLYPWAGVITDHNVGNIERAHAYPTHGRSDRGNPRTARDEELSDMIFGRSQYEGVWYCCLNCHNL